MKKSKKNEENKEKSFFILFLIFTIVGILASILSALLFFLGNDFGGGIGIISTILSILLSAISMSYTYFSGRQTIKIISNIKNQNTSMVQDIGKRLSKDNFNTENAKNVFGED